MGRRRVAACLLSLLLLLSGYGCATARETLQAEDGRPEAVAEQAGGVLHLGILMRLEGWENEASDRSTFKAHAAKVREYADIFDGYGAKLTVEANAEFVEGCSDWRDNVLKELCERGHAAGVRADIAEEEDLTLKEYTSELRTMRQRLESLKVPARHLSGLEPSLDWVQAVRDAGYSFVTGLAVEGRIDPWRIGSSADWQSSDPAAQLVAVPEYTGQTLRNLAEGEGGQGSQMNAFNGEDVKAFVAMLDEALKACREDQVNVLCVPWSVGAFVDGAVVEQLLQAIQPYVDAGKVEWNTMSEVYDLYLGWEQSQ
jgi:hypothetical protein